MSCTAIFKEFGHTRDNDPSFFNFVHDACHVCFPDREPRYFPFHDLLFDVLASHDPASIRRFCSSCRACSCGGCPLLLPWDQPPAAQGRSGISRQTSRGGALPRAFLRLPIGTPSGRCHGGNPRTPALPASNPVPARSYCSVPQTRHRRCLPNIRPRVPCP